MIMQDRSVNEDELNSTGSTWDGYGLCVYVRVRLHVHVYMCVLRSSLQKLDTKTS